MAARAVVRRPASEHPSAAVEEHDSRTVRILRLETRHFTATDDELADIGHVRALRSPCRTSGVGLACIIDVHLLETVDGHGSSDGFNLRMERHGSILTDVDH